MQFMTPVTSSRYNWLSYYSILPLLLITFILSACHSGGGNGNSDNTAPTATVTTDAPTLSDAALVPESTVITVLFSESMDTSMGALQLGGEMAPESNGGIWSTTINSNDTLTISPAATWSGSPERKLIIDASDLAGNPVATITLNYDVYRGTLYYVNVNLIADTGDGLSPGTARKLLAGTLDTAVTPATILVSAGTYVFDTSLILREGVSLYGGYDTSFTQRDPANQVSTIQGNSLGSRNAGNRFIPAIYGDGSTTPITNATIIDGFTVLGTVGGGGPTYAILLDPDASPILQNNVIHGGGSYNNSNGIGVLQAAPLIQKNRIYGGVGTNTIQGIELYDSGAQVINNVIYGGTTSSYSYAISMNLSNALVINNLIYGGGSLTSFSNTYGVRLTDSSPTLRNNIIHGGISDIRPTPPDSFAITSSGTSHPIVQNNILMSKGGTFAICFVESGNAQPEILQNNSFFNCDVLYWDDDVACMGMAFCTSIDALQSMADITGGLSGNLIADPMLADIDGPDDDLYTMDDNDWHFSMTSPVEVTTDGLNGLDEGWSFLTDFDGVVRPASGTPWAIGAYEP